MKVYLRKYLSNPLVWIAIGFVAVMGYQGLQDTINRDKYTSGEIISYSRCGVTGICVSFKYIVDGHTYKGKGTPRKGLKKCGETGWCIGKVFLVKYESENPSNSIILLDLPIK